MKLFAIHIHIYIITDYSDMSGETVDSEAEEGSGGSDSESSGSGSGDGGDYRHVFGIIFTVISSIARLN